MFWGCKTCTCAAVSAVPRLLQMRPTTVLDIFYGASAASTLPTASLRRHDFSWGMDATQQVQQSDHFLAAVYLEHSVCKDCYSLRSCLRVSDFWTVCHVTCKWEANHRKPNWNRDGEHVHIQHWQVISAGHDRNASVREVEADVIRKKGRSKLCHCVNQIYTIYILLYPYI